MLILGGSCFIAALASFGENCSCINPCNISLSFLSTGGAVVAGFVFATGGTFVVVVLYPAGPCAKLGAGLGATGFCCMYCAMPGCCARLLAVNPGGCACTVTGAGAGGTVGRGLGGLKSVPKPPLVINDFAVSLAESLGSSKLALILSLSRSCLARSLNLRSSAFLTS